MESYSGDYSDYENAPGGLATFGGFLCDFGSDFDFLKNSIDYATMVRPPGFSGEFPGPAQNRVGNLIGGRGRTVGRRAAAGAALPCPGGVESTRGGRQTATGRKLQGDGGTPGTGNGGRWARNPPRTG